MHNLIVGMSYSGKTNLSKRFALQAEQRQEQVIVFDPIQGNGWPDSAVCFHKPDAFLEYMDSALSAHVFVDEAKTLWDFDASRANALVYQKRHNGILVYLIGQRAEGMVPPNARNQCSRLFAFKQSVGDSDTLSREYGQETIKKLPTLKPGEFIATDGYRLQKFKLDYKKGNPPEIKLCTP